MAYDESKEPEKGELYEALGSAGKGSACGDQNAGNRRRDGNQGNYL